MARTFLIGFSLLACAALASAGETFVARTYDVSPLVRSSESSHSPSLGLIQSRMDGILSFDDEDASGELILSSDALERFVRQDLTRANAPKPTHFELRAGTLRVLAPAKTHKEIQASLARVRAQVARRITLEVHLLSLEPAKAQALGSAGGVLEAQHHALLAGAGAPRQRALGGPRSPADLGSAPPALDLPG